jgi:glycosyltransferase involved in cell wall biosynthesis
VFGVIKNQLSSKVKIKSIELPFHSKGIVQICLNLVYLLQFRKGLFHITGDVHYAVLALPKKSTVLTIHDLVFIESQRGIKQFFLSWLYLKLPVSRAKYITTISEKSKKEIVLNCNCDPNKILVIPDPIDSRIRFEKKEFNRSAPRFLFIGSTANKNLERTIQAISGLDIDLRIIGKIDNSQKELLHNYGINYSFDHAISDEQLIQEYIDSDAILFASTYEGFGLPVIEGFKAGRAVITSDLEPMNVNSCDAAMLVNPYEVASIRNGVIEVINNPLLRQDMVEKGFEIVKRYEIEKIAEQYFSLWSKIDEENKR